MANLSGTKVIAPIVMPSDTDTFPTHYAKYGNGNIHSVATIAERNAISSFRREIGMLCYVVADNKIYQLLGGLNNSNWSDFDDRYINTEGDVMNGNLVINGNLDVKENTSITKNLSVTGTTSIGSVLLKGTASGLEVKNSNDSAYVNLIIQDLTVKGTTTTINSETVTINDNIIVLNSNVTGTPNEDGGIEINRGSSTNASLIWKESSDRWVAGVVGSEDTIMLRNDVYIKSEINSIVKEIAGNYVASGCAVTASTTALTINVASGIVYCSGIRFSISSSSIELSTNTTQYIYINSSGVLTNSTTAPTGNYVNLAIVIVPSSGVITNITDTRDIITTSMGQATYNIYNDSGYIMTLSSRGPGNGVIVKNAGNSNAFVVNNLDDGKDNFVINGTGNTLLKNSANLVVYSDNGSARKFQVTGSTGDVILSTTGSLNFTDGSNTLPVLGVDGTYNGGWGLSLSAGGRTIVGSGESHTAAITNLSTTSSTEILYLTSDQTVKILTNIQAGWSNLKEFTFGSNGNLDIPNSVNADIANITTQVSTTDVAISNTNGNGIKFWNSDLYKIYMSQTADATGGSFSGATSGDYNMYFKMNGTNRGFVFKNGDNAIAQITGAGYFYANRIYNSVFNDYAEYFLKDQPLEAGDVVAANENGDGYIKSNGEFDSLVVGVLSDDYAQCIGGEKELSQYEQDRKYAPIGLAGRVRVKVIGEIKKGDLLVSSNIPGVAMSNKGNYKPGTVIGKALETHTGNTVDRIKMLISNM